jgi:tetratricopeptide (TPR) repeat protein
VLSLRGEHAAAETEFEAAIRLGPQLFEAYYLYARDCFAQGKLQQAAQLFEKACEVRPEDYQSPLLVAQIYTDLGRAADAEGARRRGVRIVEETIQANPSDVRALYMGANGLVALGEIEHGLEWAALALAIEPEEPMVLYNVACIDSLAGLLDDAIDCLERAVRAGLRQKGWFDHDSNLDPLRGTDRFRTLMDRLERGDWT